MILVDTSVWIDYFRNRRRAAGLAEALEMNEVLLHPWVLGEIALGSLGRRRAQVLADLRMLPVPPVLRDEEALALIEARRLASTGIGWVDAHLVGSALVARAQVWTLDGKLARVAVGMGIDGLPGRP